MLLIFVLQSLASVICAQNIINDTLTVGYNSIVQVRFHSVVDRASMPNGNRSFETSVSNSSVMVSALKKSPDPQLLIVREGGREHKFILTYKDNTGPSLVDWSDLKKLTEHVGKNSNSSQTGDDDAKGKIAGNQDNVSGSKSTVSSQKTPNGAAAGAADANALLSEANGLFKAGKWRDAKAKYLQITNPDFADLVKPRIAEIDQKIRAEDELAGKKSKEAQAKQDAEHYRASRKTGDSAVLKNNFVLAQKAYDAALKVKPGDDYTTLRLSSVQKKMAAPSYQANRRVDSLKLTEYNIAVNNANKLLRFKEYQFAAGEYKRAMRIYPDSTYPANQLQLIYKEMPAIQKTQH